MKDIVGENNVDARVVPTMGAEDFSFMLEKVPGCYVWIGNGMGEHRDQGHGMGPCMLHNGSYDFNDELLPLGATYWVKLVERWFSRGEGNS
jgi:hippurate hydrolase